MKKYKPLDNYDFSDYAEEITGDVLFKINGGAEIENSNKGVANAKPGDTLTRNDGTTVTITQGDIDWAKKQVGESETTATNSTPTSVTETSNSQPQQTSSSTSGTGKTNTTTKSGNNSTSAVSSTGTKSTESSVIQETAATAEQTTSSARTSSEYQGVPPQYWDALDEQKAKKQEVIGNYDKNEVDNVIENYVEKMNENKSKGNWIKKTVNGIDEYTYDPDIISQNNLNTYHQIKRQGTTVSWIESKGVIIPDGFELDGYIFHEDGTLSRTDGTQITQITPIQAEKYDIFVSLNSNAVDPNTLHKNFMGTSYTGPENPKTYSGSSNYDYIPRNKSEDASIIHDKAYANNKTAGTVGALLNTDVIYDDWQLVLSNMKNFVTNPDLIDKSRSLLTSVVFSTLALFKTIGYAFKPENQPNYGISMTIEERYNAHH